MPSPTCRGSKACPTAAGRTATTGPTDGSTAAWPSTPWAGARRPSTGTTGPWERNLPERCATRRGPTSGRRSRGSALAAKGIDQAAHHQRDRAADEVGGRRAGGEDGAEQHRGDGDDRASREPERSRRRAELPPQERHREGRPEVGREPCHGREHGQLLERSRERERQGDGRLQQNGRRRRPVPRVKRGEETRSEAVLGQRVE